MVTVDRVQTRLRIERNALKVLKGLAEYLDLSLGDRVEGIVLHAFEGKRSGGFEPLRFVRPGAVVVLGLISSKTPVLESQDDLRRRIDDAARYVPLENLALSPQCGFASTSAGNVLTQDEQKAKLELVAGVAAKVWG